MKILDSDFIFWALAFVSFLYFYFRLRALDYAYHAVSFSDHVRLSYHIVSYRAALILFTSHFT